MKRKIKLFIVSLLSLVSFSSCSSGSTKKYTGVATFYLEGGICQNNTERVMYSYTLNDENSTTYIADPNVLNEGDIKKVGYTIEGWYKTKIVDGDNVTYQDKWNFETDKMSVDGVTLYAHWKKDITHTYDICFKDENGKDVIVYSYVVDEGETFKDILNKANSRKGYTALPGFYDEFGNPWDNSFTHPGGDSDLSVKVYVNYIQGEYKLISTAEELLKATNKGVYLLNDINLEGEEICFNDYIDKSIKGNGHKIYNFKIKCDPTNLTSSLVDDSTSWSNLYCGLFRKIENSTIENITFEDCSIEVDTNYSKTTSITVSPFASSIVNSTIKNVSFTCDVIVTDKTKNFVQNRGIDYKLIDDNFYLVKDNSTIEESTININVK